MQNMTLKEKLQQISQLEEENNFMGVSFTLREGCRSMLFTADDLADHVLSILKETAALSQERLSIPFVTRVD